MSRRISIDISGDERMLITIDPDGTTVWWELAAFSGHAGECMRVAMSATQAMEAASYILAKLGTPSERGS